MRITFTARHFKADDKLRTFAEEKVAKIKKYYDGIIECEITLDQEKLSQVAEISVKVYGQRLHVVEKSNDIFKSIDLAVDKLERQVKKYKQKLRGHGRGKLVTPTAIEPE